MFNNQYFNPQYQQQDLLNMRDRIDKQLQFYQNQAQNHIQQPPPITQNFQIAPNNQNQSGVRYANSIDDVKKELVFSDTLFVNKEYTQLWFKNALGDVKTYKIEQVIELDEKDLKIKELMAKISELESEKNKDESTTNGNANVTTTSTKSKPSSVSNSKSSNE